MTAAKLAQKPGSTQIVISPEVIQRVPYYQIWCSVFALSFRNLYRPSNRLRKSRNELRFLGLGKRGPPEVEGIHPSLPPLLGLASSFWSRVLIIDVQESPQDSRESQALQKTSFNPAPSLQVSPVPIHSFSKRLPCAIAKCIWLR